MPDSRPPNRHIPIMDSPADNLFKTLGFLRLALIALALINMSIPAIDLLMTSAAERGLWSLAAGMITPVMAPLLTVVLLFDYIMSRIRAADAQGALRAQYTRNGRVVLTVMGITLLFWVPFFIDLMG
jgi:hypothetical protein